MSDKIKRKLKKADRYRLSIDGGRLYIEDRFAKDSPLIEVFTSGSTQTVGGNKTFNGSIFAKSGVDLTIEGTLSTDSDVNTVLESDEIYFSNLPTSDPVSTNQLWNDSGTLKVSTG